MANRIARIAKIQAEQKQKDLLARLFDKTDVKRGVSTNAEFVSVLEKAPTLWKKPIATGVDWPFIEKSLFSQRSMWLNLPQNWKPRSHNARRAFSSLLRHLMAKFPTPLFFDSIYFHKHNYGIHGGIGHSPIITLFPHVAQGGNVRKFFEGIVPLTNKMTHILSTNTPGNIAFVPGIRRAQVLALGGSERLAKAVSETRVGEGLDGLVEEEFRLSFIQWVVAHPMLSPAQVGPMLDYIRYKRNLDATFSLKGRNPTNVFRDMEKWHAEVLKQKVNGRIEFFPSGISGYTGLDDNGNVVSSITEILSSKALDDEGKKLHHCVYSYSNQIVNGSTSVWSMRLGGERAITVEVRNQTKKIVQARGLQNRQMNQVERRVLSAWSIQAGLDVGI